MLKAENGITDSTGAPKWRVVMTGWAYKWDSTGSSPCEKGRPGLCFCLPSNPWNALSRLVVWLLLLLFCFSVTSRTSSPDIPDSTPHSIIHFHYMLYLFCVTVLVPSSSHSKPWRDHACLPSFPRAQGNAWHLRIQQISIERVKMKSKSKTTITVIIF